MGWSNMLWGLLLMVHAEVHAQSQVELYQQQIAANKSLIAYLHKGISIAKHGLTAIGTARQIEFNLHEGFFTSLKKMNRVMEPAASDVVGALRALMSLVQSAGRLLPAAEGLNEREQNYCRNVLEKLLRGLLKDVEDAALVYSSEYAAGDAERWERLQLFAKTVKRQRVLLQGLVNEVKVLNAQRAQAKREVKVSTQLFGL